MPEITDILIWSALLLLLAVAASKASERLGIPALLFFLALGMAAGSDGPGGIYFNDPWVAQLLGVLALVVILFSGGLDTSWSSVRPVLAPGLALSTLGVLLTAVTLGAFATAFAGFSMLDGLLLGAIVSSTDAAAVFAVLRARAVSLKGNLQPLLELESGSNDPMAVFLTTALLHLLVQPAASVFDIGPLFVRQMALGAAIGFSMGHLTMRVVNRIQLEYTGLYPVLTLSLVLLTYGISTALGGNGFLSVYVAGIVMGNTSFIHKKSVEQFHDGLAWLMQIVMFLALGLLVFPSRLLPVAGTALLTALFLVLVARPLAVFLTLAPSHLRRREKAMVAWVGLRGAVPIILATFPLLAGIPGSEMIFDVVFFTVLISVLVQGTSIVPVARLLGVHAPAPPRRAHPITLDPIEGVDTDLLEVIVPPQAAAAGKRLVNLPFPAGSLVTLIGRQERFIVPGGDTVLQEGDVVLVLTTAEAAASVTALLSQRKPAPE
ncbi:potassium/proton antiporter [Candidatus Binatia bacterium]|nr:potassium/proton antiporter [Candidatus Binatia bacterium]